MKVFAQEKMGEWYFNFSVEDLCGKETKSQYYCTEWFLSISCQESPSLFWSLALRGQ